MMMKLLIKELPLWYLKLHVCIVKGNEWGVCLSQKKATKEFITSPADAKTQDMIASNKENLKNRRHTLPVNVSLA